MKKNCSIIDKQKKLNIKVEIPLRILIRQWSFCLVVFTILFLSACAVSESTYDVPRKAVIHKNAPGTVWLRNNLFMDETEICNLDYLEYLHWCYRKDKEQYMKARPDTACWLNSEFNYKCLVDSYLRYVVNSRYPVVGVSYNQAQLYCKWRTDRVNEMAYYYEHHLKKLPDSGTVIPQRVIYRLPTSEEWEYAAMAGLNQKKYPLGFEELYLSTTKTKEQFNFQLLSRTECDPRSQPTNLSYSGYPNRYGLYHMLGNVSEMVADSMFKGLNYSTYLDGKPLTQEVYNYTMSFRYTRPEPWLGFRCICEVKDFIYDASEPILNDLIVNNEFDSTYLNRMKRNPNFIYHFYPVKYKKEENKGLYSALHDFYVKNVQTENPADSMFISFFESNLLNKTGVREVFCSFRYYYSQKNGRMAKRKYKELDELLTKKSEKRKDVSHIFENSDKPNKWNKKIHYFYNYKNYYKKADLTLILNYDKETKTWVVEISDSLY